MNGLYIGSMGMMNYMQHINMHANNIANAQTTGFKVDQMTSKVFDTHKTYRQVNGRETAIGTVDYAVVPNATHVNLTQGTMQITNSGTDFYLEDGNTGAASFFVVSRNNQTYMTKDGHFTLNADRYLQTTAGAYVLDSNNERIRIPEGAKLSVKADGTIYNEATKQNIARLQTKSVDANMKAHLVKHEDKTFTLDGTNIANLPNGTAAVHNYMLENSNVDMTKEMTDLMTNQKMVQASQRVMTTFDKVYDKESNELLR
ncbi:flagellar hook-basal body complex protein [Bacillus sp. S14(2024)]|uniref:flagellar hook-basal body complex protein n=1 Tax=Bacillus sp. S14(2024) TaxID=3162884 RepID=UPI003D243AE1